MRAISSYSDQVPVHPVSVVRCCVPQVFLAVSGVGGLVVVWSSGCVLSIIVLAWLSTTISRSATLTTNLHSLTLSFHAQTDRDFHSIYSLKNSPVILPCSFFPSHSLFFTLSTSLRSLQLFPNKGTPRFGAAYPRLSLSSLDVFAGISPERLG